MALTNAERQSLKETIVSQFATSGATGGSIAVISCPEGQPIWQGQDGELILGCGEQLAKFIVFDDNANTWDIVADMFILHSHNKHNLGISVEPVDITGEM